MPENQGMLRLHTDELNWTSTVTCTLVLKTNWMHLSDTLKTIGEKNCIIIIYIDSKMLKYLQFYLLTLKNGWWETLLFWSTKGSVYAQATMLLECDEQSTRWDATFTYLVCDTAVGNIQFEEKAPCHHLRLLLHDCFGSCTDSFMQAHESTLKTIGEHKIKSWSQTVATSNHFSNPLLSCQH